MIYPEYCYYRNRKLRRQKELDLIKLLEKFSKDYEYIVGTINDLDTDEEIQQVMDYIQNDKDVTYESITLLALDISLNK